MDVKVTKTAGFCWGVKRAVNMAQEALSKSKGKVLTHGPLIHNRRVVQKLRNEGIEVYDEAFQKNGNATLVIRAHGLPPQTKARLTEKGFTIVDATCPHVVHAQKEVERFSGQKYHIVIAGDKNHAEVVGLTGYAGSNVTVIGSVEEAKKITSSQKILLIAQSTFNKDEFQRIAAELVSRLQDVSVRDTICSATSTRQQEVIDLSKKVDAIVVVGDKISANAKRLVSIAESQHKPVHFVEGADEINEDDMKSYRSVGVTAGASTPEWETAAVVEKLKNM